MVENDERQSDPTGIHPIRPVKAIRLRMPGGDAVQDRGQVVVEMPLTLLVEGVGNFTIMCTPTDLPELAMGFVFSEGMVDGADEVVAIEQSEKHPQQIKITLKDPWKVVSGRNLIVASSCGMCGSRNIEKMIAALPVAEDSLRVSGPFLIEMARMMRDRQRIFQDTGGTHAAAIFSTDGQLLAFAEDLGRHNALDKAIGSCLREGIAMKGLGVALSGRVSLEMVVKAARAELELIAAVSAPSSLAIIAAERCNQTLCGFVREDRVTVYTQSQRVVGS